LLSGFTSGFDCILFLNSHSKLSDDLVSTFGEPKRFCSGKYFGETDESMMQQQFFLMPILPLVVCQTSRVFVDSSTL
jgi:hypothetical protein